MTARVTQMIKDYFSSDRSVVAVYLFGSYGAGCETDLSDIDLGLLLERDRTNAAGRLRQRYVSDLVRRLRKDIHLVFLNSAGEELLRQIFLKGKCIVVNNMPVFIRFKAYAIAEIAEFGGYRERMQSGFVRKVMES